MRMTQLNLWSLLGGNRRPAPAAPARVKVEVPAPSLPVAPRATPMQQRYELMTKDLLKIHGVRVRKWRSSMSGVAWQVSYRDGTMSRLIESPRPRGPMSAAVFCHEIGHHAIGFHTYRPRCLEEYHAWAWSLRTMAQYELNITQSVRDRMHDSLHYAIAKAKRRGLQAVPDELIPYLQPRINRRSP